MKYESQPVLPGKFRERYDELCAMRDEVNAKNAPLEEQLAAANAEAEAARLRADRIAAQIDENRGRESWIALKKDIRVLAAGLTSR